MSKGHFYLTPWKAEGDGEVCKLMERSGAEDGSDAVTAEFSRYPAPLGEQLSNAALVTANAYADANPNAFAELDVEMAA